MPDNETHETHLLQEVDNIVSHAEKRLIRLKTLLVGIKQIQWANGVHQITVMLDDALTVLRGVKATLHLNNQAAKEQSQLHIDIPIRQKGEEK